MTGEFDSAHGRATRARIMGDELIDTVYSSADDMQQDVQDYVSALCWGEIFNRDGLSQQVRILINIAALASIGERDTMKHHVRAARRLGCSRVEIREAIIQAGSVTGIGRAALGCRAASEALGEE